MDQNITNVKLFILDCKLLYPYINVTPWGWFSLIIIRGASCVLKNNIFSLSADMLKLYLWGDILSAYVKILLTDGYQICEFVHAAVVRS
jgi:hypothetical protein